MKRSHAGLRVVGRLECGRIQSVVKLSYMTAGVTGMCRADEHVNDVLRSP